MIGRATALQKGARANGRALFRFRSSGSDQWEDFLAVELDRAHLIRFRRVHEDVGGAGLDQLLESLNVRLWIGAGRPLLGHVLKWDLSIGAALDVSLVLVVHVPRLPRLLDETPLLGPGLEL